MSIRMTKTILVKDVMIESDKIPIVLASTFLKKALEDMCIYRLGIVCVVDESKKLLGVITDGDVRRKLISVQKPFSAFFVDDVIDHSIKKPATTKPMNKLSDALNKMEELQVWDLPVIDENNILVGLLHLHPAVKILLKQLEMNINE